MCVWGGLDWNPNLNPQPSASGTPLFRTPCTSTIANTVKTIFLDTLYIESLITTVYAYIGSCRSLWLWFRLLVVQRGSDGSCESFIIFIAGGTGNGGERGENTTFILWVKQKIALYRWLLFIIFFGFKMFLHRWLIFCCMIWNKHESSSTVVYNKIWPIRVQHWTTRQ